LILYPNERGQMKQLSFLTLAFAATFGIANAQQAPTVSGTSSTPMIMADTRYSVVGSNWVSWAYGAINLPQAWTYNSATSTATGFTGKGTTVAVFDTGLNLANTKFNGNTVAGYNLLTNGGPVTGDSEWHGTFVAGIIAANLSNPGGSTVYGIAPNAKIMPIQIFGASGTGAWTDTQMANAINYATNNGAFIYNNSWNSSQSLAQMGVNGPTALTNGMSGEIAAWNNAAAHGNLIVFAAGNNGMKDPGYYATMPALSPKLASNWIVAVGTDQTGKLATWSNACGIAAAYCMAAPGDNIIGLYQKGLAIGSGTSFAAPMISASAALMHEKWPTLTGSQIQSILFSTANKAGIYANTAVYGQGMLDLTKAFSPIGTVTVATSGLTAASAVAPITNATVTASPAFGKSVTAGLGKVDVMVLDSYKRDYTANLGSGVSSTPTQLNNWSNQLSTFGSNEVVIGNSHIMQGVANGIASSFATTESKFDDNEPVIEGDQNGKPGISFFQPSGQAKTKYRVSKLKKENVTSSTVGINVSPSLGYGPFANGSVRGNDLVLTNSVGNPYMNMAPNSNSASVSHKWNDNNITRVGAFTNTVRFDNPVNMLGRIPTMTGVNLEHTVRFGNGYVSASTGMVNESASVLGSYSTGALSLGNSASTAYAGLTTGLNITKSIATFAGANIGYTMTTAAQDSLIKNVKNLTSTNAYAGIVKTGIFTNDDRLGVVGSLPMRVNTGQLVLNVPTSQDANGNIQYQNQNVKLNNKNIEYASQVFYTLPLDQWQSVGFGVGNRFNAIDVTNKNHMEMISMARYNLRF